MRVNCLPPQSFLSYTGFVSCPQQNLQSRNGRIMHSPKVYVVWVLLGASLLATLLTGAAGPPVTETATAQSSELPSLFLASPITGLTQPVSITHAGDGSGRIFVVEQSGRIRIIRNGTLSSTPFLNLSSHVSTGGERGLLGLAFPPGFATKQYFYVNYTNPAGNIVIARYRVSVGNADLADSNTEQVVLVVPHPTFANHNGGQLAFSSRDGFLYIGTGDGGSGGDPNNRAQNGNDLLGKILRIDVETGNPTTYTVPDTPCRRAIPSSGRRDFSLKSGLWGCETLGAFRSTVKPMIFSSPTSARVISRK